MPLNASSNGLAERRFGRGFAVKSLIVMTAVLGLASSFWLGYQYVFVELPIEREERRLLTTNVPAVMFPNSAINFTPTAQVILPGKGLARLAELDLSQPAEQQGLPSEVARALKLIKTTKLGYTVTGRDPDGTPVIHIWALSEDVYSYDDIYPGEYRRFHRLLWRNLSAFLVDEERSTIPNGVQSERLELHTRDR